MASAASDAENFVSFPISLALFLSCSSSSPVAPDTAATLLIAESKSAAVFIASTPKFATVFDTGMSVCPTPSMVAPTFLRFSPVWVSLSNESAESSTCSFNRFNESPDASACFPNSSSASSESPTFSSNPSSVLPAVLACASSPFKVFSVSTISLCSASYWLWLMSPLASASFACSPASFNVQSFSFVSPIACASRRCFCASSSVFVGSIFNSLSTSFNWDCVVLIFLFTLDRALSSPCVSPPIAIVIPLILPPDAIPASYKLSISACVAISG